MSLRNIFDVIEDLKIGLDKIPAIKEYLQNRMEQAKFGAPGATTNSVLRDLASADTLSTLTLKTMVLQHQRAVKEGKKKKTEPVAGDHVSMHHQPGVVLQTGGQSGLQLMECELESLLIKRASRGGKLVKSDRTRMRSLKAKIMRLRDLSNGKDIPSDEEGIGHSSTGNAQASRVAVANQDRSKLVTGCAEKSTDTSENEHQHDTDGVKPDNTVAEWSGRKESSNPFYVGDSESFEIDICISPKSSAWMTPSSNSSFWDA
ncbi:hypothetical protein ACHAPD_007601 [Fusarium lateritium]